ncbi:MAG: MerC domain-containing protein [Fibrella sp.]|nr:MerC domain-containing protein [Armatimonadota bacterium]
MESYDLRSPLNISRRLHGTADLDQVGMTASLICAVHCALMPMAVTLLPLVGLDFLAHESAEWMLLGLSLLIGCGSIWLGFREHRRRHALLVLAIGFALLVTGRIAEARDSELPGVFLVVLGGMAVAGAHFVNRRLCQTYHPRPDGAALAANTAHRLP